MRQQYHFRQVGTDTHIWDVCKLVALSQSLPIQSIALDGLREWDECYWFADTAATTCAIAEHMRLVQDAQLSYPIILCQDGRVMDGMHRVVKAHLAGHTHIHAVQFEPTPPPDYINVDADALPYDD